MELSFLFSRLKAALRSFLSTSLSGRIVCSLSGSSREKIPNLAREFSVSSADDDDGQVRIFTRM